MRVLSVLAAATLLFGLAGNAQAEDREVRAKTVMLDCQEDGEMILICRTGGDAEDCRLITLDADAGPDKVVEIRAPGDCLLDDDVDSAVRSRLLDERIGYLKTTGQLRTDLAIARLELQKLLLAGSEADRVVEEAKRREVAALRATLEERRQAHREALDRFLPGEGRMLMLLDDDMDLLGTGLDPSPGETKVIRVCKDGKDCEVILKSE